MTIAYYNAFRKMVNKRKTPSYKQTKYERQRQIYIEKNAMKFQALGLSKLANQLIQRVSRQGEMQSCT